MKRILTTAAALSLVILSGCIRDHDFEGILYTYAKPPEPDSTRTAAFGPVYLQLNAYLQSDAFWQNHSTLNPSLSDLEINNLRERVSISSVRTFHHEGGFVDKWTLRIVAGDSDTFESICQTYREFSLAQNIGTNLISSLLENRTKSLREELSAATELLAKTPSPEHERKVLTLRAKLTAIEGRSREITAEFKRDRRYAKSVGLIVEHLMVVPLHIPEADFVR